MNSIKKCRVCCGIARGFNYDGLSCVSCKVFFGRNSEKFKTLTCDYRGNCEINISTRKKCAKCRLVKCFAIGMKPKPEKNTFSSSVEDSVPSGIDLILEISIVKRISEYDIKQIADYVTNQSNTQQIQKKRVPLELNKYELECIAEARKAIQVFRYEHTAKVIRHANTIRELIESPLLHNLLYIKRTISFCQKFAAFNSLPNEDQLALLKPFSFHFMSIWFTFQYEAHKKGVLMFTDESETEAICIGLKIGTFYQNQEFLQKMRKFQVALYKAMENDVNIRDLLTTLVLFKTSNVSCPENIRYYYYLYCTILQRYLQCKHHDRQEGNRKYLSLMRLLDQLDVQFTEKKKLLANEFGAQNMATIIRELYDLE